MRIAFLGLGIMGKPMAQILAKAGHELTAHQKTPEGSGVDHSVPIPKSGVAASAKLLKRAGDRRESVVGVRTYQLDRSHHQKQD